MERMYKVDVWSGECHMHHECSATFDEWSKASEYMQMMVDGGMLCNILHEDFIAPAEKVDAAEKALFNDYANRKNDE